MAKLLSKFGDTADDQPKNDDTPNSVGKDKPTANVIRGKEVAKTDCQYRYIAKVQGRRYVSSRP